MLSGIFDVTQYATTVLWKMASCWNSRHQPNCNPVISVSYSSVNLYVVR